MKVYVYDPTATDELSKVRGIGRYLQILRENFGKDWIFTDDIKNIPNESVLINPFFNFLSSPLVKNKIARNQIAVIHDLIPLKYSQYFPVGMKGKLNIFLNKQSLKNYDLIITDSDASKKDIVKILNLPEEKIKVIYPILSNDFNKKPKKNILSDFIAPNKYCIYVGDATWNKNLVTLAQAIKEINVTCVFVGKIFKTTDNLDHPWQQELKTFLQETKNDKRFIFPGFVSGDELNNLYKNAACNILVSRDEGFGFTFLEAASLNTPSVLSDINVLKETAQDSAFFAYPENHSAIANQIGELYFNDDLRNVMGKKARKRSQFFSREKFKNEFRNITT